MKKLNKIEQQIVEWSEKFPCDRWWREKHNIPFMSTQHKEISFLDQLFEFYEDVLLEKVLNEKEEDKYNPNSGNFIQDINITDQEKIRSMSEEFEREFGEDLENG